MLALPPAPAPAPRRQVLVGTAVACAVFPYRPTTAVCVPDEANSQTSPGSSCPSASVSPWT